MATKRSKKTSSADNAASPAGERPKPKPKAKPKVRSAAFARIRAEVIRLVGLIPSGKFTTYGSIAVHMNVVARHVATVMSHLTEEESAVLPWHRVVSSDGRISQNMEAELSQKQRRRLESEGMEINAQGYIQDSDAHFHVVGPRRSIRWSDVMPASRETQD